MHGERFLMTFLGWIRLTKISLKLRQGLGIGPKSRRGHLQRGFEPFLVKKKMHESRFSTRGSGYILMGLGYGAKFCFMRWIRVWINGPGFEKNWISYEGLRLRNGGSR